MASSIDINSPLLKLLFPSKYGEQPSASSASPTSINQTSSSSSSSPTSFLTEMFGEFADTNSAGYKGYDNLAQLMGTGQYDNTQQNTLEQIRAQGEVNNYGKLSGQQLFDLQSQATANQGRQIDNQGREIDNNLTIALDILQQTFMDKLEQSIQDNKDFWKLPDDLTSEEAIKRVTPCQNEWNRWGNTVFDGQHLIVDYIWTIS